MKFEKFNKIPRLSREIIITEKIDGTNGQIVIVSDDTLQREFICPLFGDLLEDDLNKFVTDHCLYQKDDLYMFAGSKSRWLNTSSDGDNHGFAKWVKSNAEELFKLGEGKHFGEWYGQGIQRGYELNEKRFALFNVKKWSDDKIRPACCETVPILWEGIFDTVQIDDTLNYIKTRGSFVVKGFMQPEGIIIFHTAGGQLFKKTILDDEKPKGQE